LFGKWTYVNYTATILGGNISRDAMGIISGTDMPGTITFNKDGTLIQTAGDVMAPGVAYTQATSYRYVSHFFDPTILANSLMALSFTCFSVILVL
jgi:hypothetical protein